MRNCYLCGEIIDKCNGFVLARDFLLAIKGIIEWSEVREKCGRCVLEKGGVRWIRYRLSV